MVGCVDSANAQRKCPRHAPGSGSTPGRLQPDQFVTYAWATSSESAAVDTRLGFECGNELHRP
jgi:hypothetical protein